MGVRRSLFASSALAVLFACSSESIPGPGNGTPAAVASVDVSPGTTSLFAGRTVQLTAAPKDAQGATLSGRVVTWSSNNSASVSVTNDGLASAAAFGSATITATSEGKSASATITVLHDPVIFIHGFQGSVAIWTTMVDRLKVDGWTDAPLLAWTYDSNQSNVTTAQRLQTTVDSLLAATGAKKVDIIAHSMGGLSSRYFSKNLAGSEKIDGFVFLGTPNHGTTLADLCPIQSCLEMRPGSVFLAALNAGDETPGNARYATWWTPCDQLTTPPESVVLDGATNTQTACMGHSDLYINSTVYAQVRDWVR